MLSGAPVLVGSIFGVAAYDAIAGDPVEVTLDGVWDLPKATGQIDQGDPVFFDGALGVINGASGAGLFPVGAAVVGAATDATTVRVRLNAVATAALPGT